jgi:hypothetical protein
MKPEREFAFSAVTDERCGSGHAREAQPLGLAGRARGGSTRSWNRVEPSISTFSAGITEPTPFSSWTKTFTDPRLCAAIVDRLTFAGQIIETGSVSYRLAHARPAS